MNILDEIDRLPYYLYVFDDRHLVLGGQSVPKNTMSFDRVYHLWEDIKTLYEKQTLSNDEKVQYAENVKKMADWNPENHLSREELKEIIDSLSDKEKGEIKWQIEMYKHGRELYRDYIHNK